MSWTANIFLSSKDNVLVTDLEYIQTKHSSDENHLTKRITEFKDFIFLNQKYLSFVGKDHSVTLPGNVIEYISLTCNS